MAEAILVESLDMDSDSPTVSTNDSLDPSDPPQPAPETAQPEPAPPVPPAHDPHGDVTQDIGDPLPPDYDPWEGIAGIDGTNSVPGA